MNSWLKILYAFLWAEIAIQSGSCNQSCKMSGEVCRTSEECCPPKEAGAPSEYKYVKCGFHGDYHAWRNKKGGKCEYVKVQERWDYVDVGNHTCWIEEVDCTIATDSQCCKKLECLWSHYYRAGNTEIYKCKPPDRGTLINHIYEDLEKEGHFRHNGGNLPWKPNAQKKN